jgi:hypothetical protein
MMSLEQFCGNLEAELSAWKESISSIADKLESRPGHVKSLVREHIEDIRILARELEDRVHQLSETCSIDGFENIVTERSKELKERVDVRDPESAVESISAGNFGG